MRSRILAVLALLPFLSTAFAQPPGTAPIPKQPPRPSVQKFCPVMTTDEIDREHSSVVMWKDKKIYLCCDTCVRKFKRDPAAYLDASILPQIAGEKLPRREIEQSFCPVLRDRKVSRHDPSTLYQGVKVYFYNDIARQRFLKDPRRYADPAILPQLKKK